MVNMDGFGVPLVACGGLLRIILTVYSVLVQTGSESGGPWLPLTSGFAGNWLLPTTSIIGQHQRPNFFAHLACQLILLLLHT